MTVFDSYMVQDEFVLKAGTTYSFSQLFHYVLTEDPKAYDTGLGFITYPLSQNLSYTLGGNAYDVYENGSRVDYYYNIFGIDTSINTNYAEYIDGSLTVDADATNNFTLSGYIFTGHGTDTWPGGYHSNVGVNFTFTIGGLFTASEDNVNFNSLDATQIQLVAGIANLYNAMGGNDRVWLPNTVTIPSTTKIWDINTPFLAGAGDDTINGGNLTDYVNGGDGNDSITGGAGSDKLYGGNDNDTIGAGGDLFGGTSSGDVGGNWLYGDSGDDQLISWLSKTGAAPDHLTGGADIDSFFVDTTPGASDVIEDFSSGETAFTLIDADPTRYTIFSSNQGTKVNFFTGDGGPKVASFEFATRILPQDITVEKNLAFNALSVTQERDNFAHVLKVAEGLIPFYTAAGCYIFEALKDIALTKGTAFAIGKAMPLILDKFVTSPTALSAVSTVLSKYQEMFENVTPAQLEKMAQDIIEKSSAIIGDLVITDLAKGSCDSFYSNTAFDIAKLITTPLQVVSPAVNWTVRLGDVIQRSLALGLDTYFAAEASNLLSQLPDTTTGTLDPLTFDSSSGKTSFIQQAVDLTTALGGSGKADKIYSTVDVQSLPSNVEGATLLNADPSFAQPQLVALETQITIQAAAPLLLNGNSLHNQLIGNDSSNTIRGMGGSDFIVGGGGDDSLFGGVGHDTILGDLGDDVLSGSTGNDTMDGGAGNDTLNGGAGADALTGGDGVDTLSYAGSLIGVKVNLATKVVSGGDAAGDTILSFEKVVGSSGNDVLIGNAGNNTLIGGLGNDAISGGAGADVLIGGTGSDILTGGMGKDVLIGDTGNDRFTFKAVTESALGANHDVITDFTVNVAVGAAFVDRIVLAAIDAQTSVALNNQFTYISGDAFTAEGQLRAYQSGTDTIIEGNTTGTDGAEFEIVLANFTFANLTAAEFVL